MNIRWTAILGLLTGLFFLIGFIGLFILNPQTYEEVNNLSLASYNLDGMKGRLWAAVITYGLTGFLNILFCVGLLINKRQFSASLIGIAMMMICGLIWISFGCVTYAPLIDFSNHLLLIRLIVFIAFSLISFFLLGNEYHKITQDKFLKWHTIFSASLITILSFLSVFVYNDDTWLRTNISLITYFTWFIIVSIYLLMIEKNPPLVRACRAD